MRLLAVLMGLAWWTAPVTTTQVAAGRRAECFLLARAGEPPFVSSAEECARATAPASTFKIPHALIALEAGVITRDTVFKWDGTPRAFKSWQRDHTLASAIQWSVLPYFENTARQIGRDRMQRSLATLRYAADTFERDVDAFWLNGDLVISPLEQLAFLERLAAGTLAVSRAHQSTVMEAMRMPSGRVLMGAGAHPFVLTRSRTTTVRSKTGNATVADERVSWLMGLLDHGTGHAAFVARVRAQGALPSSAGADLALRELNTQGRWR